MHDLQIVQCFESAYDLDEDLPYVLLAEARVKLLVLLDLLEEVTVVSVLHYYAVRIRP